MTTEVDFGHGWEALTDGINALQSSELFRREASAQLNQEAYYGPAGVMILVAIIGRVAYMFDLGSYRRLGDGARITLINRALFGLVYVVSFVPYTVSTYFIYFAPTSGAGLVTDSKVQVQLESWALRLLSFLLGVQLSMHVSEGACRSVVDVDYFLVLHHIVQCAFPVLAFQSQSPFALKLTVVVSCFASYEFLLYAALICSTMPVLRRYFRWLTILGFTLYGATRVLQTFLLVVLFKVGFGPMNTSRSQIALDGRTLIAGHTNATIAVYWISMFMCIVITAQQLWKLVLYRNLWRSTTAAATPIRTSSGTLKIPRGASSRTSKGQDPYRIQPQGQGFKSDGDPITRDPSSDLYGAVDVGKLNS